MNNRPISEGTKCRLKDGSEVYIIIVHRPGNGYGVSVSPLSKQEYYSDPCRYDKDSVNRVKYYPWHQFKRLIADPHKGM